MSDDVAIPAATVLLLRDEPQFEVLMVERHQDVGFAGGALVFPGGRIDPGDGRREWFDYSTGLSQDIPIAQAQIASIREAFEEAGVLLARKEGADEFIDGDYAEALGEWRDKIEDDDQLFLHMIQQEKLSLACDALLLFARWVAPKRVHKRFDTWFFAARTPVSQRVLEDGNEATEALWITPENAIAARKDGSRKIIFPTARNLELLNLSANVDDVFNFANTRKIEAITPNIEDRKGESFLTIPSDLGYPVIEESMKGLVRG